MRAGGAAGTACRAPTGKSATATATARAEATATATAKAGAALRFGTAESQDESRCSAIHNGNCNGEEHSLKAVPHVYLK